MESSPPAVQAVPQGPRGQGLRVALSRLPALPARRLAGGAGCGQDLGRDVSGHTCTHVAPGSPRASSRHGGWAPRASGPPKIRTVWSACLWVGLLSISGAHNHPLGEETRQRTNKCLLGIRYADDTMLMAGSKKLKRLLVRVKEESESVSLKLNVKKD